MNKVCKTECKAQKIYTIAIIKAISLRIIGAFLVYFGIKCAEIGYKAMDCVTKDIGSCALILIPAGLYMIFRKYGRGDK